MVAEVFVVEGRQEGVVLAGNGAEADGLSVVAVLLFTVMHFHAFASEKRKRRLELHRFNDAIGMNCVRMAMPKLAH